MFKYTTTTTTIPVLTIAPVVKPKPKAVRKRKPPVAKDPNVIYGIHYKGRLLGTFTRKEIKDLTAKDPNYSSYLIRRKIIGIKKGVVKNGVKYFADNLLDEIEIVAYKPATSEKLSAAIVKAEKEEAKKKNDIKWAKRNVKNSEHYAKYYKDRADKEVPNSPGYHRYMADSVHYTNQIADAKDKLAKLLAP